MDSYQVHIEEGSCFFGRELGRNRETVLKRSGRESRRRERTWVEEKRARIDGGERKRTNGDAEIEEEEG